MALHYIIAFIILLRIIVNYLKNHTQLLKSLTEEKKDECYMVYYAYVILMENIIRELELVNVLISNI